MLKHTFVTILVLLSLLFTVLSHGTEAGAVDCIVSSAELELPVEEQLPSCDELYPEFLYSPRTSPWRVGFSAGVGERSNPLINSDDIPIYGVIQLSYFGERFFFDNGDFGWGLGGGNNWSANLIAGVGGERSFYSFLNDSSIGFSPVSSIAESDLAGGIGEAGSSPAGGIGEAEPSLAPLELALLDEDDRVQAPDRDLTVDGGVELLFSRGNSEFQLQLLTDISNQHNGQEIWFSWGFAQQRGRWEVIPSIGFNWKSDKAANYYYGVREEEAAPGLPAYEVDAALNVFGRLSIKYSLNEHWKIISLYQYERLDKEISDSSSVQDDHVQTAYLGLYYEF